MQIYFIHRPRNQVEDFIGGEEFMPGTEKRLNSTQRKRVVALKSSLILSQKGLSTGQASLGRSDAINIALHDQSRKKSP